MAWTESAQTQVGGGGEPAHVDTDLGDDDLRDPFADPGIDSSRVAAQRKGSSTGRPRVETGLEARQLVNVIEVQAGHQGVMVVEAADQRFTQLGIFGRIGVNAMSASTWVTFTVDQRFDDPATRHPCRSVATESSLIRRLQHLLQTLHLTSPFLTMVVR